MRNTEVLKLEIPTSERIAFLTTQYGALDKDFLKTAVLGIAKKLGPLETKLTLQAIDEDRMRDFITQVLVYYDKTYQKGVNRRNQEVIKTLVCKQINPTENAKAILNAIK
jgi:tRNA 2-selenouridine synthase